MRQSGGWEWQFQLVDNFYYFCICHCYQRTVDGLYFLLDCNFLSMGSSCRNLTKSNLVFLRQLWTCLCHSEDCQCIRIFSSAVLLSEYNWKQGFLIYLLICSPCFLQRLNMNFTVKDNAQGRI